MDFQALKVLQERVEKLAGEMMLADFESESTARQLLDQVLDIAERAEAQGLLPESRLCQQLVDDFTAPSAHRTGSFESRLGSMVEALQGLLGGGVARKETPEPVRTLEPGNGWEHSLASLPTYVSEAILKEFIENLGSTLDEIQHLLLSLEQEFREDELAELRRHLHTIKSDAGLLGQKDIERLCHLAEDLLRASTDRLVPEPLFLTWDWLKRQLDWVRGSSEAPESPDGILVVLKNAALEMDALAGSYAGSNTDSGLPPVLGGSAPATPTDAFDDLFACGMESIRRDSGIRFAIPEDSPILRDFLNESLENLENLDVLLLRLEHQEGKPEDINAVFRAFHTIKGLAGFFALDVIKNLAHQAESILDRCRNGDQPLTGPILDLLFDCKDR